MKSFLSQNGFFCLAIAAVLISVSHTYYQNAQLLKLDAIKELSNQKDTLIADGYNEMIAKNNLEAIRGQGRIEGILSVIHNHKPDDSVQSAIWHDGYYRGLEQTKEMNKLKDYLQQPDKQQAKAE